MAPALLPALILAAAPDSLPGGGGKVPPGKEVVMNCHPGKDGILEGGPMLMDRPPAVSGAMPWPVTTIESNGPVGNRIDFVFVGDGFQASQMGDWAAVADARWATIVGREPYASYRRFFNAHRVDVVSADSGVDNDPTQGIARNTALDMGFWCGGVERLLCVDTSKAAAAAASAPHWDQILAVANSYKYGGAGYGGSDTCTFSGSNYQSLEIAVHELGHSFGDLGDEYQSLGTTYSGPEFQTANLSIQTEAQMQASNTKWATWLGVVLPVVGTHGSLEGANNCQFGARRPTDLSLMRALGYPFNGPSLERMVVVIHQMTVLLDSSAPVKGTVVTRGTPVVANLLEPSAQPLVKQWRLGGVPIPGATGAALDTRDLPVGPGGAQLSLVLIDPTDKVRNEALRAQYLTEQYSWTLGRDPCPGDLDGDGRVSGADIGVLLGRWGVAGPAAGRADIDADGSVGGTDLGLLLAAWGGCPG